MYNILLNTNITRLFLKKKKININGKQVVEEGKGREKLLKIKIKSCLRKVPIIEGKQSFLSDRRKKDHTMVS